MQDAIAVRRLYRRLFIELALIALAMAGLALAATASVVRLRPWPAVGVALLAMLCGGLLMRLWGSVLARAEWLLAMGGRDEGDR